MKYWKQVSDGYIECIGTGSCSEENEITKAEYDEIKDLISNRPGDNYKLSINLTWEEVDLSPETVSDEEVLSAIADEFMVNPADAISEIMEVLNAED